MGDRDLIAEGHAIDAALTPGPWYAVDNDVIGGRCVSTTNLPASESLGGVLADEVLRDADADGIAGVRNLLPALLDALEAAQLPEDGR